VRSNAPNAGFVNPFERVSQPSIGRFNARRREARLPGDDAAVAAMKQRALPGPDRVSGRFPTQTAARLRPQPFGGSFERTPLESVWIRHTRGDNDTNIRL